MSAGRIPCVNPRCRRTAAADKYEGNPEIICEKCFRTLPDAVRHEHRRFWREIRKWDRRIARNADGLKAARMHSVRERFNRMLNQHWDTDIKAYFVAPVKPVGLDAFLEEVGL